ncbi:MAG: hypothetical protein ABIG90_00530 [bacterium]
MSEVSWKNRLKELREKAKKNLPEDTEQKEEVKFPWFMLITSIPGDLVGWFNVIMILLTAGVWVAISGTIWNATEAGINIVHFVWYSYCSSSGISVDKKQKLIKNLAVNKIVTTLFGWIPIIGDAIPKLTISTFVFYAMQKAMLKNPVKI